jgi:hypothetical protein
LANFLLINEGEPFDGVARANAKKVAKKNALATLKALKMPPKYSLLTD